jgi:hypothetical protein
MCMGGMAMTSGIMHVSKMFLRGRTRLGRAAWVGGAAAESGCAHAGGGGLPG